MKHFTWLVLLSICVGCGSDNTATLPEEISKRPKMSAGETTGGVTTTGKAKPGKAERFVP